MNTTGDMEKQLLRLRDMSCFLEEAGSLDDNLLKLAERTAGILGARNCSILLLNEGEPGDPHMRVCAAYGLLPAAAYQEAVRKGEGIAGHVVATGESLLVEDIGQSPFVAHARRAGEPDKSLLCCPIRISACIAGVVNVTGRDSGRPFTRTDLNLLDVAALFIGKSIQTMQLQNILNSRFAQLAVAQQVAQAGAPLGNALHNPDKVARIIAKSFYREMIRTGFGPAQVIHVASDLIAQLNSQLQRHNKRLGRRGSKNREDIADRADKNETPERPAAVDPESGSGNLK